MRKFLIVISLFILILTIQSCSKDDLVTNTNTETNSIKGNYDFSITEIFNNYPISPYTGFKGKIIQLFINSSNHVYTSIFEPYSHYIITGNYTADSVFINFNVADASPYKNGKLNLKGTYNLNDSTMTGTGKIFDINNDTLKYNFNWKAKKY